MATIANFCSWFRTAVSSRAGRLAQIAVSVALAGWVASTLGHQTWRAIQTIDLGTIATAVLLFASAQVFGGLRLAVLLAGSGISPREAIVTTWIGYFASTFLPSTVGGDFVRAVRLKAHGVPMIRAAGALVLDRLLNLSAVVAIMCSVGWGWVAAGVTSFGMEAVPVLAFAIGTAAALAAVLWRLPAVQLRLVSSVRPLLEAVRKPQRLIWTIVLSFMSVGAAITAQWLLARGLGMTITLPDLAAVICAVTLIVLLPVSLNGLGLQEGTFVVFLSRLGVDLDAAVAFAILSRALIVAAAIIGAAVFALDRANFLRRTPAC